MSISTTLTWSVTDTTRDTSDGFIVGADVALTGIATITSEVLAPLKLILFLVSWIWYNSYWI